MFYFLFRDYKLSGSTFIENRQFPGKKSSKCGSAYEYSGQRWVPKLVIFVQEAIASCTVHTHYLVFKAERDGTPNEF